MEENQLTPTTPVAPVYVPAKKAPILPILFGFLVVIVLAVVIGVVYSKNKLVATPSPEPLAPTATPLASPEPSGDGGSASPQSSPKASPKTSFKPVSVFPSFSPTPTPVPLPTLDIRFTNPSANIKQTIDEGAGDGRVINREYTSIQTGQFDEVKSAWSPKVTVCFHLVSNQNIRGSDVKFTFTQDDKVEAEDTLSQYDQLEAGRTYDWCHDVNGNIGKHTVKLLINPTKSLKELNYTNDLARLDWENLADKISPNFTLIGPNNEGSSGTCLFPQYISDNVTPYSNLKINHKIDSADWTKFVGDRYCFTGTSGSSHAYSVKITDERGNAYEQSKNFVLY